MPGLVLGSGHLPPPGRPVCVHHCPHLRQHVHQPGSESGGRGRVFSARPGGEDQE